MQQVDSSLTSLARSLACPFPPLFFLVRLLLLLFLPTSEGHYRVEHEKKYRRPDKRSRTRHGRRKMP
eukprot:scaffold12708_cov124-Amphora_coffeaeformis.AAC.2